MVQAGAQPQATVLRQGCHCRAHETLPKGLPLIGHLEVILNHYKNSAHLARLEQDVLWVFRMLG